MSAEQETDQERSITFCLYESWEKIAGSSGLPALKRLQRQEIEAFKSNLVLLDLRNGKDNPIFQVIGNGLTEDLEVDLVGRPIAEVPRRSMLSRVTDHYLEVLANRVPIAFEAEFVNREGEKALYRGILLPFSDDNQNINFILGGVRWILAKDVQLDEDKPTIEELMRTIASGRDEITLENEEDVLNEDQLDATLSQETTDDTLQERDIAETAVDVKGAIDLEDASFDANSVAEEKVVFEKPHIDEISLETTSEEAKTSEEIYNESVAPINADTETDNEDNPEKINEPETKLTVEEAINLEDVPSEETAVTEEKVVFDEPPISETSTETTSDEIILTEEVPSKLDGVDNDEPEEVAEEVYLEIDETTSFEEGIIEKLTAHDEQEEDIKPEELDLSNTIISEPTEEGIEDNNEVVEVDDQIKDDHIAEAEEVAQEEPPVKEKLKKRARKGSVIERLMEMLLGKSKKKDIFGHEIRSAESKITLPTQPDPNDEIDIMDEQADVDFAENEGNLNLPEQNHAVESSGSIIDEDNTSENASIVITKDADTVSDTISVSFEGEINKVMDDADDQHIVDEGNPEIITEDSVTITDSPDDEIILEETTEPEPEGFANTEEVTSYGYVEEEINEESSLKLENEIHEEISAQEEELLETSVAESNQSNIALETGTDEEKEEITFDVTEAEDIADDATIIEQQVASSEPIITDTSHDISAQKEEKSEEENLRELQDSLKQIIRYIKKEDASHNRSRDSLYNILTAIYKFHSVCENSPVEYSKLVAENGLKIQERAPFTPVLKICLGKDYDKTRLTEYAAALGIAKHMNVDVEDFHDFIKHFPGGIKGCVKEMRAIRKGSNGANLVQQSRTVEEARNVLRDMPVIGRIRLKKMIVSKDSDEFCLLLAKRRGHDIDVLKVLDDQYTKIDPILKRAAFINGNLKKEN
ncbi:hypothetical protein N9R64_02230 [Emcibacteraceae bacterium]|nr:hypothetical protein [Emcibacteraceae bacterium]MDA9553304.1 hypothetical protein [Emcibacteraceae bacterium]